MSVHDTLFGEVDNGCAYCGQRGLDNLTRHHIDQNSDNNDYDNQIILCHNCHHRYHNDKGISGADIKKLKSILIGKTLTQYGINALKLSYRNEIGVIAMPFLLYHLVDLGYMSKEELISSYGDSGLETEVTARFVITEKGKSLYEKWFRQA